MTFTDEHLSAFLDAELPPAEMAALREALAGDEQLADRLAELAMVDATIAQTYGAIDQRPMPEAVTELLKPAATSPQVLAFPLWRRIHRSVQHHGAIAASVTLVLGFALARLIPADGEADWPAVAAVLEHSPSGISQSLTADTAVKPRLTFVNQGGDYCRQFQLIRSDSAEESIACRRQGHWQLEATLYLPAASNVGDYRTATGGSTLDTLLDQSISQGPFDRDMESSLITNAWSQSQRP